MSELTLKDISDAMKGIDICMMTTDNGRLESRPMSNNRDVEYDGDSYFFADASEEVVRDINEQPQVNLAFVREPALVGKSLYISVSGDAALVRDKAEMQKHWTPDLDAWFKNGVDTPGVTMIHVKANSIRYWKGRDQGTVTI
jgi:general stress protein 26